MHCKKKYGSSSNCQPTILHLVGRYFNTLVKIKVFKAFYFISWYHFGLLHWEMHLRAQNLIYFFSNFRHLTNGQKMSTQKPWSLIFSCEENKAQRNDLRNPLYSVAFLVFYFVKCIWKCWKILKKLVLKNKNKAC